MLLTVDISSSASYFYFNVATNMMKNDYSGFLYCVFIYGLGLTGFVQFIDITFSCCLISSVYLTCKQYYNVLENKKK